MFLPVEKLFARRFPRLRSRFGVGRIFGLGGHFSWQPRGKPRVLVVQSQPFVAGAGHRHFFSAMCRSHGRRSIYLGI